MSDMQSLLKRFQAKPVDKRKLDNFQHWALDYFHNSNEVIDPLFSITLQLEITQAWCVFQNNFQQQEGATFTAYLIWNLIQSIQAVPELNYRQVDGVWYELSATPICMPIYVGGRDRFREVYLENSAQLSWPDFIRQYRHNIDAAKIDGTEFDRQKYRDWFRLATFIGNLPNTNFTALNFQRARHNTGRALFYFGQRQQQATQYFVPFSMTLDHSNADGYIADQLIVNLRKQLHQL